VPKPRIESRPSRFSLAARWLALGLALSEPAGHARSAARAQLLSVGHDSGLATCAGIGADNAQRARTEFPRTPVATFRVRVPGGIGQAPVSDRASRLIIAHAEARLSKFDTRGLALWSQRLPSEAAAAPVLTSDGSILIVTRDGEALLFTSAGTLRARRMLPIAAPRHRVLAIPTAGGGAFVACGTDLIELGSDAEVLREARVRANVSAIAEASDSLFAFGENGTLTEAHATGNFEPVGNFGGEVADGAAARGEQLLAIVDGHKLVSFDRRTRTVSTLADDGANLLSGPPLPFENGTSAVVLDGTFVSFRSREGNEAQRAALLDVAHALDPADRDLRPAQLVGDAKGAVVAVRGGTDAQLVNVDGSQKALENTACLDPFRATPSARGFVLACRSGQLFGFSDKAP